MAARGGRRGFGGSCWGNEERTTTDLRGGTRIRPGAIRQSVGMRLNSHAAKWVRYAKLARVVRSVMNRREFLQSTAATAVAAGVVRGVAVEGAGGPERVGWG